MGFSKRGKRLKCDIDGRSRLSDSDSEIDYQIFPVQQRETKTQSTTCVTVNVICTIAITIGALAITIISLWISGIFNIAIKDKTIDISVITKNLTKMVPKDEIKESPLESACFDVPNVCRELLPYKYTSRFLPTLSNIEFASMNSSTHTCIEDSGKSLNDAFVCFLKYPPCAAQVPLICASSCPSKHCLSKVAKKNQISKFQISNPKQQHLLSAHYIKTVAGNLIESNRYNVPDLQNNYCSSSNSLCFNLTDYVRCAPNELKCLLSGQCIDQQWLCDGINDCGNWEDEINCKPCREEDFKCGTGECVQQYQICDGHVDCQDESDEINCPECAVNQFTCGDGRCIPSSFRCDGDVDCSTGADEEGCSCRSLGMFECSNQKCISKSKTCDGENDCIHGEDELNCHRRRGTSKKCSRSQFWCNNQKECVDRSDACTSDCSGDICTCKATDIPICGGTRTFPSILGYVNANEVMRSDEYNTISILLNTKCHQWLHELGCGFISPTCHITQNAMDIIRPCRGLCESVKQSCEPVLNQLGYSWPPFLSCLKLPITECLGQHLIQGCPNGTIPCSHEDGTCIPADWKCDGFRHCANGDDEIGCPNCEFRCRSGVCLPASSRCNGETECDHGDDEENCEQCSPKEYMCANRKCIPLASWCDGLTDCTDFSDEIDCYGSINDVIVMKRPKISHWKGEIGELNYESEWIALCGDYFDSPNEKISVELERTCTRLRINPTPIESSFTQSSTCSQSLTTNSCPTCGVHKSRNRRVLLGKVPSKYAPWISSVTLHGEHHCGGTLVTNTMLISAAHCFYNYRNSGWEHWRARIGQKSSKTWLAVRKISSIKIHPLFKQIAATYDFDLSLIRLAQKVDITTACLPPVMPKPGAFCRVSGWGQFDRYSRWSRKLKTANVHIVDQELCQRIFPFQHVTSRMVCAGHPATGVDACTGDSGGPLECKFDGKWTLVGIVSWGQPGCPPPKKALGVYTNVYHLRDWISGMEIERSDHLPA